MYKLTLIFKFLLVLRCSVASNITKTTLPVLLMDLDNVLNEVNIKPNPFDKIGVEYFFELSFTAQSQSACVLIFVEDTLCTEDISSKDLLGTPFYYLRQAIKENKVIYMPAVVEPYALLRQAFQPEVANVFKVKDAAKLTLNEQYGYAWVYFEDEPNMLRTEMLRKHDAMMREMYLTLRQERAGPILAYYTGMRNPIKVEQLRYAPKLEFPKKEGELVVTQEALFRLTGIHSSARARRSSFEETPVVEYEMRTRRSLSTTMLVSDFHLQFNFEFEREGWNLENVVLLEGGEEVGRTRTDISAPWRRSYYCAEPIVILNRRDGSHVTLSEYQMEPLHEKHRSRSSSDVGRQGGSETTTEQNGQSTTTGSPGGRKMCFSTAKNCGPYFNTRILCCGLIFVLFLLTSAWGVVMIINCGINNRFDDPTQKPLVVDPEMFDEPWMDYYYY